MSSSAAAESSVISSSALISLQKRELGRHAFETRMPERVANALRDGEASNALPGVIHKLAGLLQQDDDVQVAYLCTASAVQVCKVRNEGGNFCGYRNMQMLCHSLPSTTAVPSNVPVDLTEKLNIIQLQDLIEAAWDAGHNCHGRIQTGGVKGTRKHIGTSEAEAVLLYLGIPCTGSVYSGKEAWHHLLDAVEAYYSTPVPSSARLGLHMTKRPPIFLQRPKHSITIVGIERLRSGKRALLAFDPAYFPPGVMRDPSSDLKFNVWRAKYVLAQYRKTERYLKRYNQFETLAVDIKPRDPC